ncbi:unnamed protein product [Gongylonema pulchrum]|uniref:DNA helicase n=1 Tax=Gongylonema pulchrum TaxID=637853 RepID=A0A183D4X7_9BILA|nr:unnamed protein product [Gongylonema pulchrum]
MRILIHEYTKRYKRLIVISGTVNDFNHDGLADENEITADRIKRSGVMAKIPTHIFAVLIRCSDMKWTADGHSCKDATQTRVLSFVLPNHPDDLNCLDVEEYLRTNTARVRDIELLTGLEFFTSRSRYPETVALKMRTYIQNGIWST